MEKQEQLAKLSILPVNKTVVFYSPIEGRDVLVRTGTIPDESCFYHSLLHSYSKEYVSMGEQGRKKLVARLRASLASNVDRDRWEKLSGGLVSKIPFQENVNNLLVDFYKHINNGKPGRTKVVRKVIRSVIAESQDLSTYQVITEMLPLKDFQQKILPNTYDECGNASIKVCKEKLIENSKQHYVNIFDEMKGVDTKRIDYCINKMTLMVQSIADEAENLAFSDYVVTLKDTSIVVDRYTISMVSNRFNRDIFFLDAGSRMPYLEGGTNHIKKRKAIIVMWTGGVHYEIVGRLLPGNRIQREFAKDDPLIERLRTFICHPEKITRKYPSLIPYLPKQHRKSAPSDSRSRSRSSSNYEESSSDDDFEESNNSLSSSPDKEKRSSPKKRYRAKKHRKHYSEESDKYSNELPIRKKRSPSVPKKKKHHKKHHSG